MRAKILLAAILTCGGLLASAATAQKSVTSPEGVILPIEALALPSSARAGRMPVHMDPVQHSIVAGTWADPTPGATLTMPDESQRAWSLIRAEGEAGIFQSDELRGGYLYTTFESDVPRVMLLHAAGHGVMYFNGEPRAGDPYMTGAVQVPVLVRQGLNRMLFHVVRAGRLEVRLLPTPGQTFILPNDATLPDIIWDGTAQDLFAGLVFVNATTGGLDGWSIEARYIEGPATAGAPVRTPVPPVAPLSSRKVRVNLPTLTGEGDGDVILELRVIDASGAPAQGPATRLPVRVRPPRVSHLRTFESQIDGTVQYFAVRPSTSPGDGQALILALHGASVSATGHAEAYSPKTWGHIVAPTNRREFGFDWEDWGRLDGFEVLDEATRIFKPDPSRVYLTGHSMGGHGSWVLSTSAPDRFAAVGPSASWINFWTYAAGPRPEPVTNVDRLMQRSTAISEVLPMIRNLAPMGVYILHGDADRTVPVAQARQMRDALKAFHTGVGYFEQAGADHWWETGSEPGAECVDWPPMFDMFASRRLASPAEVRQVRFETVFPGFSSSAWWLTIEQQIQPLVASGADLSIEPLARVFRGVTWNTARLSLNVSHLERGEPFTIMIDGQTLTEVPDPVAGPHGHFVLHLEKRGETWAVAPVPSADRKGPHRAGMFKDAFRNRVLLVYGTAGSPEETAWAINKARLDSENFWVRGNGSFDIIPDTAFNPSQYRDRNVVLYGNADTNSAWATLLGDSPVVARRGELRVGARTFSGDDYAAIFIRPRKDSTFASVGAVTGSGLAGLRATDRLPYFVSGVAYPDVTVLTAGALLKGPSGIVAAGFFGDDWSVEAGTFEFLETP